MSRFFSWLFRRSGEAELRKRATLTWVRQQMELHPRMRDELEAGITTSPKAETPVRAEPWLRLAAHRRYLSRVWSPDSRTSS